MAIEPWTRTEGWKVSVVDPAGGELWGLETTHTILFEEDGGGLKINCSGTEWDGLSCTFDDSERTSASGAVDAQAFTITLDDGPPKALSCAVAAAAAPGRRTAKPTRPGPANGGPEEGGSWTAQEGGTPFDRPRKR